MGVGVGALWLGLGPALGTWQPYFYKGVLRGHMLWKMALGPPLEGRHRFSSLRRWYWGGYSLAQATVGGGSDP